LYQAIHAGDSNGGEKSADVVGIRQTSSDTRTNTVWENQSKSQTAARSQPTSRKMNGQEPAQQNISAISFGVFCLVCAFDQRGNHAIKEGIASGFERS
jgi:hypothetical protein